MVKKTKLRIVALLLSVCMVFTLMPVQAMPVFAEEVENGADDNSEIIMPASDGNEADNSIVGNDDETVNPLSDEDTVISPDSTDGNLDEGDADLDDEDTPVDDGEDFTPSDPYTGTYESFLKHFKELENYANSYTDSAMDATELVINFMRTSEEKYREGNWESFCGPENEGFTAYVLEQDKLNDTDAYGLRKGGKFSFPNGQKNDLLHMFAVMNMTYTMGKKSMDAQTATNYADLGGWAGDLCDMLLHTTRDSEFDASLELEPMTRYIFKYLLGYTGSVYSSTFGRDDLYADLDAYYIMNEQKQGKSLSSIMEDYYTTSLTSTYRAHYFIANRLGGATGQGAIRKAVEDIYSNSFLIKTLESTRELRSYNAQRKACCYAFADYLYAMVNPPECDLDTIDLTKGQSLADAKLNGTVSYFGETVKGSLVWKDSSIVPEESGYQVAIFTPEDDFHYTKMEVKVPVLVDGAEIGGETPDQPDPEEPDEPDPEEPEEKPIYEVFSSKSTTLAPGVTQTINYSNTIDDKQMVYYVATADTKRDDVTFYANYNNNDPSSWGMQTVLDQMNAAKTKHSNPDDADNYIENYSPVVGINGDYFAMTTDGAPYGALIMGGTEYHGNTQTFFGVLKDGTPIIGGSTEWKEYKGQIQEAVGSVVRIVHNGEVVYTGDSTKGRAGFSAVGYTADGQIVFVTVDGRQEPFSCGCNDVALGQIMKEAGCVEAVQLDGGGSTTFCSKPEGQDEISVVNRPSDGYPRRVGSSLMIVSTAKSSKEFDHATIEAEYDYLSVGTEQFIKAFGVSNTGNAAPLPENVTWTVDNENVGTISEDGIFTAKKVGDAVVSLMDGDTVLGTITMHVVRPNGIGFAQDEITAIFGESTPLPVTASYNGNPVKLSADTDLILLEAENSKVGSFDGIVLNANNEDEGCRTCKVTAYLWDDFDQNATALIRCYKAGEATFDFENATGGDRSFAWDREVSNSEKIDDYIYHIVDPSKSMDVSYVFSLDMNYLAIPPNIEAALPELAAFMGADISEVSAWQLLVALADRVSPSTTVNISMKVDPKLNIDYSELTFICEYFDLTSITFDEDAHELKMVCNWIKQDGPIDVSLANPVCIISGIKATVKDDVVYDWRDEIELTMTGSIDYNARLRSSQAYQIAAGELGQEFGLSPYDNRANLENDMGAQFSAEHCSFTDKFILSKSVYEGWSTLETGEQVYYQNNEMLKGVHYLTEPNGTNQYYYSFDENGICEGKYTGFVEENGIWYYPLNGTPATGWREIDGNYHYFKTDGSAQTGSKKISGVTYNFIEKGQVESGVWVTTEKGTRYYYGPSYYKQVGAGNVLFVTIDGKQYGFDGAGYRFEGLHALNESNNVLTMYDIDENGVCNGVLEYTGVVQAVDGYYYYIENGICKHPGLVKVDDDYYFISSSSCRAYIGEKYVNSTAANGLMPAGIYTFGEDGKMILKNGVYEEDGKLYYYEKNVKTMAYLVKVGDDYYFAQKNGLILTDSDKYVRPEYTNDLLPVGTYTFGSDGKMILKNGIYEENGNLYYYENNVRTMKYLVKVGNDYYFAQKNGLIFTDGTKYVRPEYTNNLLASGTYAFGSDGKMLLKNGIYEESGSLYYYENNARTMAYLIKVGDDYYFAQKNGLILTDSDKYVRPEYTNGLLPVGIYTFGSDGKLILKNGLVQEDGSLVYYEQGLKVHAGLIQVGEDYYYIDSTFCAVTGTKYIKAAWTNGLMPAGTYEFGPDGKMLK